MNHQQFSYFGGVNGGVFGGVFGGVNGGVNELD